MQEIGVIVLVLVALYLLIAAFMYFYQRRLIYYPVAVDPDFDADEITFDNAGTRLHGWILNPGRQKALIYFGGNSEMVTHRSEFFRGVFTDYSVYLVNYRGYGKSEGKPSEAGLFSDALAIYDTLASRHQSISAYGRSLGSGVAVFLAARRRLEQLILLTPYDSVAAVAQRIYPMFPVRFLLKDHFDSAALASDIGIPVLLATAERDREIPLPHSLELQRRLTRASVSYLMVAGAAHNDIVDFAQYRAAVADFIQRRPIRPDGRAGDS